MQDKPVALVTGANQGIGLQIAKDLVAHGFTVLVGSRNLERGEAAAKEHRAGRPRAPARRDGSGLDRRRGGAHPQAISAASTCWSTTRQSRIRAGCPASPSRSTQRQPAQVLCRSMRCARCGRPTCSASSPFTRRCCRSCANRRRDASSTCRAAVARWRRTRTRPTPDARYSVPPTQRPRRRSTH